MAGKRQLMNPARRIACFLTLILVASTAAPALAEPIGETLIVGPPPGYKIALRDNKNGQTTTEWVPAAETVNDWSEMVTVQIFHELNTTPNSFMFNVERHWRAACPNAEDVEPIAKGLENGYPAQVWILHCPHNPSTNRPETTWFKAIQGNESFYVVQKAFKFSPNHEQVNRWIAYLKSMTVCDSRMKEHACAQTEK
jgi:hypothetical protein